MQQQLAFEFTVLARMTQAYRCEVLGRIGMSEESASELASHSSTQYPQTMLSPLTIYRDLYGEESDDEMGLVTSAFQGSRPHRFIPLLWPHLYWVVYTGRDGRTWGADFHNQAAIGWKSFDASLFQPGLITRHAIESLADHVEMVDGWDEHVVLHCAFEARRYEGTFVFGLLQEWSQTR
jgi:hypothetical protein